MPHVAVRMPATFENVGEYLADVTALEAAGANTIWVDDSGLEPWVLLGAMAGLTRRVRLGCLLYAGRSSAVIDSVTALQLLSSGRCVVGIRRSTVHAKVVAAIEKAGAKTFAIGPESEPAGGVIYNVDSADQLGRAADARIEVWAAIPMPLDRAAWTSTLNAYEGAGATGVIVPWDARLVDLLRNSEPDDRPDLWMSTG